MKALLATLLVASSGYLLAPPPPRVEAQNSRYSEALTQNPGANVDTEQVRKLSDLREKLVAEQSSLEDQTRASLHDLDARQNRLKLEIDELAAKRDLLIKS